MPCSPNFPAHSPEKANRWRLHSRPIWSNPLSLRLQSVQVMSISNGLYPPHVSHTMLVVVVEVVGGGEEGGTTCSQSSHSTDPHLPSQPLIFKAQKPSRPVAVPPCSPRPVPSRPPIHDVFTCEPPARTPTRSATFPGNECLITQDNPGPLGDSCTLKRHRSMPRLLRH